MEIPALGQIGDVRRIRTVRRFRNSLLKNVIADAPQFRNFRPVQNPGMITTQNGFQCWLFARNHMKPNRQT
jgi:hypothetical protein